VPSIPADGAPQNFLSCYLTPPGEESMLLPRHDQSIALWRWQAGKASLVRVWELERLTGQKHHYWPLCSPSETANFIQELLAEEDLQWADIAAVWGTPGLPHSAEIVMPKGTEEFPVHSLAHLFSAVFMDTALFRKENIIGMSVDLGPDYVLEVEDKPFWYVGCVLRQGHFLFAPVESPAAFYDAAWTLFGLEPGSLMALASLASTKLEFDVKQAVQSLNLYGGSGSSRAPVVALVEQIADEALRQLGHSELDARFSQQEHLQISVMAVVQRCCEEVMRRNVRRLCALGDVVPQNAYLSTSGGFALNCLANSHLVDEFGFKGLLTPPCANDSGQSLGLGLLGLYGSGLLDRSDFALPSAYFGPHPLATENAFKNFERFIKSVSPFVPKQFVADITSAPVAWIDGAAEIGPRALGHRSLLGDPRRLETKQTLNRLKRRQWWRPVAPVIMAEHARDWFDCPRESPYMLEVARLRKEVAHLVPAVEHLDGTARFQTLHKDITPALYAALEAFHHETGIPLLCNTSLNDKDEPIVDTASEAMSFCLRRGVRVAYIESRRVELHANDRAACTLPMRRKRPTFEEQYEIRDRFWKLWLERGYSDRGIYLLTRSPKLRNQASRYGTAKMVNEAAERLAELDANFALSAKRYAATFGSDSTFTTGTDNVKIAGLDD
jgi:carbamoyltransferase